MRAILTHEEKAAALRLGAYIKFAECGVRPSMIKQAVGDAPPLLSPAGLARAIVTVSVLTGVPLGIAAHTVGRHVAQSRGRERELETQTQYYRNAAQQLGTGLLASTK